MPPKGRKTKQYGEEVVCCRRSGPRCRTRSVPVPASGRKPGSTCGQRVDEDGPAFVECLHSWVAYSCRRWKPTPTDLGSRRAQELYLLNLIDRLEMVREKVDAKVAEAAKHGGGGEKQ